MKIRGNKLGSKRHHKPAIAAVAVGALLSFQAGTARADSTAAEIRFLKERLKQLEEKVTRQDKQIRGVAKFPAMPPAPETPIVCKDGPCPPPPPAPPPVFVSFANGLKVESFDQAFSFKIGGRVFVDGGVNSQPVEAFFGAGPFFPPHGGSGSGSNVRLRQARLEVEGQAWRDWFYKFQVDFAGASNGLVPGAIRDAYLAWTPEWAIPSDMVCKDQDCPPRYIRPITFQVGSMYEPTGLERTVSSKYRDFVERSLGSDLFGGDRHIGFAAVVGGDAPGFLGKSNYSFKAGIFSTSLQDGNPSATGAPVAGSGAFLNPVPGGHQYWDAAARLTYAPVVTEESLVHLGGWVRNQKPNDSTAASNDRVLQPGLTLASEANVVGSTLLGTQPLTCVSAALQLIGQNCTKNVLQYGAELVGSYGPFSVQGEYIGVHYNRDAALINFFRAPGDTSINFNAFYVYATWYLTGESRAEAYKTYPKEFNTPANFGQIKILNPVSAGGWGAWELAARVSQINLNDGGFLFLQPLGTPSNIQGGRESNFTLGLNWYPVRGIRFMANWVNVFQYSANFNRPDLNGINPNLFVLRAQVDW